jgi:hypothetical protein
MNTYTQSDWEKEYSKLDRGEAPGPCPNCRRTGFYGPRGTRPLGPGYHACKFCGLWQYVDQLSFFAIPTVHSCGNGPTILGAPQIWWEVPEHEFFDCRFCPATQLKIEGWRTNAPHDDRAHPWRQVPQGLSLAAYKQFWKQAEPWLAPQLRHGFL